MTEEIPKTPIDSIREKLTPIANAADDESKKLVAEIIRKAKAGLRLPEMVTLSPAACALLFLNENGHNRDFTQSWAEELARRAQQGLWRKNNHSLGFYRDGEIADGQHRLAMAALAGFTLEDYIVVYGMERDSISSVDCGKPRDGASHAKLDGIQDAALKQSIVKTHAAYMDRVNGQSFVLRSPAEVQAAIEANDALLDACIRMGDESTKNRVKPVFSKKEASTLAFVLVRNSWPDQRVREKLALFQAGESQDGPESPYFVAGQLIEASRAASDKKNRLTGVKQLGVAIYAMVETERGLKATAKTKMKAHVMGKVMPDPSYPSPESEAATA